MTIKQFNQLCTERKRENHPNMAAHTVPACCYKQNSANALTKSIIAFLQHHGCQAERISVEGRVIDGRKIVQDVMGVNRQIGSVKRVWSSGRKGSADISSVDINLGGRYWSKGDREGCMTSLRGWKVTKIGESTPADNSDPISDAFDTDPLFS